MVPSWVIPPANFVCGGVYCFHVVRPSVRPSVRASVCPSVTFCFLNNLKSNSWIFIKLCKNIHICKTNTLNKKVRAKPNLLELFPFVILNGFYIGLYANLVHTWADHFLPQLLIKQFDTLPIQCRHIEHMHEGVWFRKKYF